MQEIKQLLDEHALEHFEYDPENKRIVYMHESGTALHREDFKRLVHLLDVKKITYESIGIDVIFIL